jgi:hypothetical protein
MRKILNSDVSFLNEFLEWVLKIKNRNKNYSFFYHSNILNLALYRS